MKRLYKSASLIFLLLCVLCFQRQPFRFLCIIPVSILYKFIAGRYRPVRVADGPMTARYRFIKNASWDGPARKFVILFLFLMIILLFSLVLNYSSKLDILMGTNYMPFIADLLLFSFSFSRDIMLSLSHEHQPYVIEGFISASCYLDNSLNIANDHFESMAVKFYQNIKI